MRRLIDSLVLIGAVYGAIAGIITAVLILSR